MEDRHVRILLEDIRHKFETIREWQVGNQPKLDKIDGMAEKIEKIESDIEIIKTSIKDKVNQRQLETLEKVGLS